MTHGLHRYSEHYAAAPRGDPAPVEDDAIVLAVATPNVNDDDLVEKYRTFVRLARAHNPVNVGDPDRVLAVRAGVTTLAAVFRRREDVEAFIRDLQTADLGLSITVCAPMETAAAGGAAAGLRRHSVQYSVGFQGRLDRLPERVILEIATMCGHGMIAQGLVRKLLDSVKEGRRTPAEAAACLTRFCPCAVFNPARAHVLLERARTGGS